MIEPVYIKRKTPLLIEGQEMYYSRGNKIFKSTISGSNELYIGSFDSGFLQNLFSRFGLASRIGRLGFHGLKSFRGGLLGIQKGKIVFKEKMSFKFKEVFSDFRGSRPLNLYVDPTEKWACFGEYFGNTQRDDVKIFQTDDGYEWNELYRFRASDIRHIHGIIEDSCRNGIWCLTGDSDTESALWFSKDHFKTLEKVNSGSQKARAVQIIPSEKGLIVPMDSPLEKNFINFFNLETNQYKKLESLPGSAFHAIKSNGIYFVSTVTEPSKVNTTEKATIYASLDGFKWKCLYEFKRDMFPVRFQRITRYSEILIPEGDNNSDYIVGYVRAVEKGDSMIIWQKEEVVKFLKNSFQS